MRVNAKTIFFLLVVAVAAAAIIAGGYFEQAEDGVPLPNENYRIPTTAPPVEPDRPDLFEEQGLPEEIP